MLPRREYPKTSKIILGTCFPVVHELLDVSVQRRGIEHGYLLQGTDYLGMIEALLGQEARREAILHILQDWDIVTAKDVETTKEILEEGKIKREKPQR